MKLKETRNIHNRMAWMHKIWVMAILCLFFINDAEAQEDPLYVLIMGQSNAVGWHWSTYDQDNPGGKVKIWHWSQKEWQIWNPYFNPPQTKYFNTPLANNIAFHFGKQVFEETGREVRVIFEAEGGKSIDLWVPEDGVRWQGMLEQIKDSQVPRIDVILWHQGEADIHFGVDVYENKFDTLLEQFKQLPKFREHTVVIAGQVSNASNDVKVMNTFYDPVHFKNKYNQKKTYLAEMGDYEAVDGDPWHFKPESLARAGREAYYHQYEQFLSDFGIDPQGNQEKKIPTIYVPNNYGFLKLPLDELIPELEGEVFEEAEAQILSGEESNIIQALQNNILALTPDSNITGKIEILLTLHKSEYSFKRYNIILDVYQSGGNNQDELGLIQADEDTVLTLSSDEYSFLETYNPDNDDTFTWVPANTFMQIKETRVGEIDLEISKSQIGSGHVVVTGLSDSGDIEDWVLNVSVVPDLLELGSVDIVLEENAVSEPFSLSSLFPELLDEVITSESFMATPENLEDALIDRIDFQDSNQSISIFPTPNMIGETTWELSGEILNGTRFVANVNISLTPVDREIETWNVAIEENSSAPFVSISSLLTSSGVPSVRSLSILEQTNQELFQSFFMNKDILRYSIKPDTFGKSTTSFSAFGIDGRTYIGAIEILVSPKTRTYSSIQVVRAQNELVSNISINPYIEGALIDLVSFNQPSDQSDVESLEWSGNVISLSRNSEIPQWILLDVIGWQADGRPFLLPLEVLYLPEIVPFEIPDQQIFLPLDGAHVIDLSNLVEPLLESSFLSSSYSVSSEEFNLTIFSFEESRISFQLGENKPGSTNVLFETVDERGVKYASSFKLDVFSQPNNITMPEIYITNESEGFELSLSDVELLGSEISTIELVDDFDGTVMLDPELLMLSIKKDQLSFDSLNVILKIVDVNNQLVFLSIPLSRDTYQLWLRDYFDNSHLMNPILEPALWGKSADPDQDGWDNLTEYAFGGSPIKRESKKNWLSLEMMESNVDTNPIYKISFRKRVGDSKLAVVPQVSNDQLDWMPLIQLKVEKDSQISIDPNVVQREMEVDTSDLPPSLTRYFRIKVSRQ